MDEQQVPVPPGLRDFEQVYLGRLRLAAQVILETVPDLELLTDPLAGELVLFKERVEFLLLVPEYAVKVLPWRRLLNGEEPPSGGRQAGNGDE